MNKEDPKDNYCFSQDYTSSRVKYFEEFLIDFKGAPEINCLEIGTFEGRTAAWFVENILTGENSKIYIIDPFNFSHDISKKELLKAKKNFLHNFEFLKSKAIWINKSSNIALPELQKVAFDFIYIDGSHTSAQVLTDAIYSFNLLKIGGIIIFDDYAWRKSPDILEGPKLAIDSFSTIYSKYITVLFIGWCFICKKISGLDL